MVELLERYKLAIDNLNKQDLIEIYDVMNRWGWDERLGAKPDNWDSIPDFHLNKQYSLPTKRDITSPICSYIRKKVGNKVLMRYHHLHNCDKTKLWHEIWYIKNFFERVLHIGFYSSKNKKFTKKLLRQIAESNNESWVKDNYGNK